MNIIHNTETTKCTLLFLRYLYYIITLSILTCFNPQRIIIIIRETSIK